MGAVAAGGRLHLAGANSRMPRSTLVAAALWCCWLQESYTARLAQSLLDARPRREQSSSLFEADRVDASAALQGVEPTGSLAPPGVMQWSPGSSGESGGPKGSPSGDTFSGEEAAWFVSAVGGEKRLRSMIEHLGDSEAETPSTSHVAEPGQPATVQAADMDETPMDSGEQEAQDRHRGGKRMGKKRRKATSTQTAAVGAKAHKNGDSPALSFSAPPKEVAKQKRQPGENMSDNPRLRARIADLIARFDSRPAGSSPERIFAAWGEEVMSADVSLLPDFMDWLDSGKGVRFLLQRFGNIRAVQKVKRAVREAASKLSVSIEEVPELVDTLKKQADEGNLVKQSAHEYLVQWDAAHPGPQDSGQDVHFIVPPGAGVQHIYAAQLQARVLTKAAKFFVNCDGGTTDNVKELRFRIVMKNGQRSLEARYLGQEHKYPSLQPWVIISPTSHDLLFVGIMNEEAVDPDRQFFDPLDSSNHTRIEGIHAFSVSIVEHEPMITLYHAISTDKAGASRLDEHCLGATRMDTLRGLVSVLKATRKSGIAAPSVAKAVI